MTRAAVSPSSKLLSALEILSFLKPSASSASVAWENAKDEEGVCMITGKPSTKRVLFAKAY